ncbi:hypothetical protein BDP27DRAFT_1426722 [Rhodocollybia butyracea]|uniref:Uncharacterized protein n=1 Tax=Rhodocollybia butyracea TaxID=206335 RepID=A0A9P5PE87_9AGAR|nr:hypothetical protein BDP27DRAFT_1426722 [Rhodocollybia butyracea]
MFRPSNISALFSILLLLQVMVQGMPQRRTGTDFVCDGPPDADTGPYTCCAALPSDNSGHSFRCVALKPGEFCAL